MSHVAITGNLTKDPKLQFTPAGKAVVKLSVAVTRTLMSGGRSEESSFFNVVVWDTMGENVAETFNKGDRVVIYGRLVQRQWEDKDGNKRYSVEITADSIGPDLRWATAVITRNPRPGVRDHSPVTSVPDSDYATDEEPF